MINKKIAPVMVTFLLLILGAGQAQAQSDPKSAQQKELEEAIAVMRSSGMDPDQISQIAAIMQGTVNAGAENDAAQLAKESRAFEESTAESGNAYIDVDGVRYDLKVTQCDVNDQEPGLFSIAASQQPGHDDASLYVTGGGRLLQSTFLISIPGKEYESEHTSFDFDGNVLSWSGVVQGAYQTQAKVTIYAECSSGS